MYIISRTNGFKKAVKRCLKRGLNIELLEHVINLLAANGSLPAEYKPHKLSSKFDYAWECHMEPDWLLIWPQDNTTLTLVFIETGTHSDILDRKPKH